MQVSRPRRGDPAAAERTTVCASRRSLSTVLSAPRRRGDPMPASTVGAVSTRVEVGVEGPPTLAGWLEEAHGPLLGVMAGPGSTAALRLLMVNRIVAAAPPSPPRRGGDPMRASTVGAVSTRMRDVSLEVGVEGRPTQPGLFEEPYGPLIRVMAGSGSTAPFSLNRLAAAATAAGRGGGCASSDMYGYDMSDYTSLELATTTEIDEKRGVDAYVASSGNCMGDMVERSRVCDRAIQYLVMDDADCVLDMVHMDCERQMNDIPHRRISSSRSHANVWFFVVVLFSLLTRAVSVDTKFNITPKMDDFQGYCPAPPFQSKFVHSSILAPTPTPTPNIVHPSCFSVIAVLGSILSVLSNCGMMMLINTAETVIDSRRKWVGFSSGFFTAAYQLWILHLYLTEPSDLCKFISSLMLLVLHLSYWFIFSNMQWKAWVILIGSIFVCLLGGISGFYAGVFAIIFMLAGHACRLWSARNDLNGVSLACVIIGLTGSVFQSTATGLSLNDMSVYQAGSLVVLTVRALEVLIHFEYITREDRGKLFPQEWRTKVALMAHWILPNNKK